MLRIRRFRGFARTNTKEMVRGVGFAHRFASKTVRLGKRPLPAHFPPRLSDLAQRGGQEERQLLVHLGSEGTFTASISLEDVSQPCVMWNPVVLSKSSVLIHCGGIVMVVAWLC